jgi:oligogalacturonide lyase
MWIEALYPASNIRSGGIDQPSPGALRSEHLVDMSANDYTEVEPNVRFSPDNRFVIFMSNMLGDRHVFAVELNKTASVGNGAGQ